MSKYRVLNDEQVQSFLDKGYLVVHDCLDIKIASRWVDEAYDRLGYSKQDPATWQKDIVWMDHKNQMPVRELAPKAWAVILDVIGGEDRLETTIMHLNSSGHFTSINSFLWSDAFIVNFHRGADQPWQPPSAQVGGWHKDGSYFRHFLDSREQALLPIVLWSDMLHQGGGTFIAPDSVRVIARYLYEHPEGVDPHDFNFQEMIRQCSQFEEVTGKAGDFVIMHPFMLHASSQNVIGQPRFMSNPPVVLKEPMNLNRANPDDFSLLERATLRYLGLERLDFQPAAPRESFWHPE
ncbi:MAG: phytanoyl-CoA dioxygenase family protein [Chloroflexi bacterium]|nr:phytanoyl-CoA dioxygenase family protein [Chloroflexota bacterium]MCL5275006.1 phytanoyl-CoA dioxygenase family protein [Chloroflexota bacterium]